MGFSILAHFKFKSTVKSESISWLNLVFFGSARLWMRCIGRVYQMVKFGFLWFRETVDEMYRGEFDIGGCGIALNIEDTGGNYVQEFR